MDEFIAILTRFRTEYFDSLSHPAREIIKSDWGEDEESCMEVDDFLQFTLIEGFEVPEDFLIQIEKEIHLGWDPELTDRTLGWIAKHRAKNQTKA